MSNLKTLQKLKELHSLYLLPELVGYPGSAIAVRGLLSLGGITGFAPGKPFAPSPCKSEKWKQLLFLRMTDCFDEARSPLPEMSKALPSLLFLTRLWKGSEGRKIALLKACKMLNFAFRQKRQIPCCWVVVFFRHIWSLSTNQLLEIFLSCACYSALDFLLHHVLQSVWLAVSL